MYNADSYTQSYAKIQNNRACKNTLKIAKLGLGFAERNLTLTIDNPVDNTPEIAACIKFRRSGLMVLLSPSVTPNSKETLFYTEGDVFDGRSVR